MLPNGSLKMGYIKLNSFYFLNANLPSPAKTEGAAVSRQRHESAALLAAPCGVSDHV